MQPTRVLTLSSGSVACAFASRLAVDAGCEVVKLEPVAGDPLRARHRPLADWLLAGQRSVAHEGPGALPAPDLKELLRHCAAALVDETGRDWLLTAHAGACEGKLVVVGERDTAALARVPAGQVDEFLAFHACGLGFLTPRVMPGYPSGGPLCPQANLLEFLTGLYGAIALFALLAAARPAQVRAATVGLCGSALPLLRREIAAVLLEAAAPHRSERIWKVSPAEVHRCRDGWLFVDIIEDVQWTRLCEWMGRPDLASDTRYASREARFAQAQTLCAILDEFFAEQPQDCWKDAQRQGVPVAPVNDIGDLLDDEQLQVRGFWSELEDASGRPARAPRTPMARVFGPSGVQGVAAPGQDTAQFALGVSP